MLQSQLDAVKEQAEKAEAEKVKAEIKVANFERDLRRVQESYREKEREVERVKKGSSVMVNQQLDGPGARGRALPVQ